MKKACFIIAEIGVNHNGNLDLASQMVSEAAQCGANAVKFQSFRTEKLVSRDASRAEYQKKNDPGSHTQFEMLKRLELSENDHLLLQELCHNLNVDFLSTPFDYESANFLNQIGVSKFKISSGDLTNTPFLRHVARFQCPMIVSTGMANLQEVSMAVNAIQGIGIPELTLLQCVSNYPADPSEVNLRGMSTMAHEFGCPVGYSDHVIPNHVAFAAVALGATVVEKHFTLDRSLPGPDHSASIIPSEFSDLVHGIRTIESAMGTGVKCPAASEKETAVVARKSLISLRAILAGTVLTPDAVSSQRPGTGIPPSELDNLLGRVLCKNVEKGEQLTYGMFDQ